MDEKDLTPYLNGEALYGDDFTPEQLEAWYRDEQDGYYELATAETDDPEQRPGYAYHALNQWHGFRRLGKRNFGAALSLGGAYGDEITPVLSCVKEITIIEPGSGFASTHLQGVPLRYIKPQVSGEFPFSDDQFGLVLCFGTLHHIANVSKVLGEIYRCLKPGGCALIREPITSMGDWRKPRPGLTRRERGIPLPLFDRMIAKCGFQVLYRKPCMFSPINRLGARFGFRPFLSKGWVWIDQVLSLLFRSNYRYHAITTWQKMRPSSVFYVLQKGEQG